MYSLSTDDDDLSSLHSSYFYWTRFSSGWN